MNMLTRLLGAASLSLCALPGHANLVQNASFENGFASWTASAGASTDSLQIPVALIPHSGTYSAELGNIGGLGVLSQTISNLVVGQSYVVSFYMVLGNTGQPSEFRTDFGGATLLDLIDYQAPRNYTLFSYDVVANATPETLAFETTISHAFFFIDDVGVNLPTVVPSAVPEPASIALVGVGLALGIASRRRAR